MRSEPLSALHSKVMLRNSIYYRIKPFLPEGLRLALRRWFTRRMHSRVGNRWPILAGSERPPDGWSGWPQGKKFAIVLTHDIESPGGLDRCRQLMELEMELGFRSSFNFIPEGPYRVPSELREELVRNGFEIGVHDFKHDGHLYRSPSDFAKHAAGINRYLQEWGAVGFRSGFMLHNLDWLHALQSEYDASTFDTDPFEPQPHGKETIFPFWVPRPCKTEVAAPTSTFPSLHSKSAAWCSVPRNSQSDGYIELPYSLPQDSTLFLFLQEKTIDTWKKKLDWIASHGGMALLDTHPDYMDFSGRDSSPRTYPVRLYVEFLKYVRARYGDSIWHAVPRDVARYAKTQLIPSKSPHARNQIIPFMPLNATLEPLELSARTATGERPSIWIDLDNTPHVPLFEPIVEELSRRGYKVLLTARDAFQVWELADQKGMSCLKIGRHYGKNRFWKVAGLFYRALQLAPAVLRGKPVLGLSHGSRSQIILCNLLGIPTLLMADYEFAKYPPMMRPSWEMVPDSIDATALSCPPERVKRYAGLKEDVYVSKLIPDPGILTKLGLSAENIIVTVRPPATEAHYHNPESEKLFTHFMNRASQTENVRIVLLPRNKKQGEYLRTQWPEWFDENRSVVPQTALDGLNLLWHSDLVVSGGGTMNREAAALGLPVYSIFRGTIGAVDRDLQRQGRLILVENLDDVEQKILLSRRQTRSLDELQVSPALAEVVGYIEDVMEFHLRN